VADVEGPGVEEEGRAHRSVNDFRGRCLGYSRN
jgi:hypothetical protein